MDHYLAEIGDLSEASRPLPVELEYLGGFMKRAIGSKTLDAAQNDVVGLFPVPSHAVLSHVVSHLMHGAFGASVTADIGFAARPEIGYAADEDALAADLDIATAGTKSLMAGVAVANFGKPVWELAGLSADPGGRFWVTLAFKDANPASAALGIEQGFVAK